MVGSKCFLSWPTKKFSLQNREKTKERNLTLLLDENAHVQLHLYRRCFSSHFFLSFFVSYIACFFFSFFFFLFTFDLHACLLLLLLFFFFHFHFIYWAGLFSIFFFFRCDFFMDIIFF